MKVFQQFLKPIVIETSIIFDKSVKKKSCKVLPKNYHLILSLLSNVL